MEHAGTGHEGPSGSSSSSSSQEAENSPNSGKVFLRKIPEIAYFLYLDISPLQDITLQNIRRGGVPAIRPPSSQAWGQKAVRLLQGHTEGSGCLGGSRGQGEQTPFTLPRLSSCCPFPRPAGHQEMPGCPEVTGNVPPPQGNARQPMFFPEEATAVTLAGSSAGAAPGGLKPGRECRQSQQEPREGGGTLQMFPQVEAAPLHLALASGCATWNLLSRRESKTSLEALGGVPPPTRTSSPSPPAPRSPLGPGSLSCQAS